MSKTFDLVTQDEIDSDPSLSERDLGKLKYTDFGDPKYIVNDHWFRISAKFLWKDSPLSKDSKGAGKDSKDRKGRKSSRKKKKKKK